MNVLFSTTGDWSMWGTWSECTVSCGGGYKVKTRSCVQEPCVGNNVTSVQCADTACPTPSVWMSWQPWGACRVTCGGGMQSRERQCSVGSLGGPCQGNSTESMSCNTQMCPGTLPATCSLPWGQCSWVTSYTPE